MIECSTISLAPGQPALHLGPETGQPALSHWGGLPRVPRHWSWPQRQDGTRLSFLGQIDLGAVQSTHRFDHLPDDGLLLFFYDTEDQPWGFSPEDKDGFRIEYVPAGTDLVDPHLPPDIEVWEKCGMSFRPIETYEDGQPFVVDQDMDDEATDALIEFISTRNYGNHPHHQVGGFPDAIQNPAMENECELASNGIDAANSDGYSRGHNLLASGGAKDWRLVLQIDSDDDKGRPGWMWGDSGMLYFWVKKDAGRAGDFSNAWLVLQCC